MREKFDLYFGNIFFMFIEFYLKNESEGKRTLIIGRNRSRRERKV
jgi:hypothetical protein